MKTTDDDGDETVSSTVLTGRPAWMSALQGHAEEWLKALPEGLITPPNDLSPLARFFAREAVTGVELLKRIRQDLADLVQVCSGVLKQTNELRTLMSDLNKGETVRVLY
jgi:dynein heavy chain 1